jgi:hypothetical protein
VSKGVLSWNRMWRNRSWPFMPSPHHHQVKISLYPQNEKIHSFYNIAHFFVLGALFFLVIMNETAPVRLT